MRNLKPIVSYNPSPEIARALMTERLSMYNYDRVPKVLKKLPKNLRGWVNPDTLVIKKFI